MKTENHFLYRFIKKYQLIEMHRKNIRDYCEVFDGLAKKQGEEMQFLVHLMKCDHRAIKRIKAL